MRALGFAPAPFSRDSHALRRLLRSSMILAATLTGSSPCCRTLNPDEADFFYAPMYLACFTWPVLGWADGPW